MLLRQISLWASLTLVCLAVRANAQTPSVKQSSLAGVRKQLTHYDLSPQGTLALLPQLAQQARAGAGSEAAEAAFLHAAAATDLLFLADYAADETLRAGLASHFGVPAEGLPQAISAELAANAHGVYREPALAMLASLQRTAAPGEAPSAPSDVRRDAAFLHAAAALAADPLAGARFAELGSDICAGQKSCPQLYAALADDGRRVLGYFQQLSAAAQRLEKARGKGDPLAEAVAAGVDRDFATLRGIALRLPAKLHDDLKLQLPGSSGTWPAPDLLVLVSSRELRYARLPRARPGTDGKVEFLAEPAAVYPALAVVPQPASDAALPTRAIDAVVEAMRAARAEETNLRVALVADSDVSAQLVARALVSLRKAGMPQLVLAARTKDGSLLGVPLRVVLPTIDQPGSTPDLKLRVRLGGYSLDVGHGTVDIPRVRDESGYHFDLAALQNAAKARAPKTAAVSFMPEVATEQVLKAMFHVTPERAPVDLVIQ
ncbi:MAG TPA: hypothetical protein VJR89_20545 [Polyangiales bacterium]|nr:hypothetical protein [Polyangiales bacterium]